MFRHYCLLFVIAEWQLYNASSSLQNDLLANDQTGKLNSAVPSQWGCKINQKAVILSSYRNDLAAFRTSSLFDLCVFGTKPGNKISPHKPWLFGWEKIGAFKKGRRCRKHQVSSCNGTRDAAFSRTQGQSIEDGKEAYNPRHQINLTVL